MAMTSWLVRSNGCVALPLPDSLAGGTKVSRCVRQGEEAPGTMTDQSCSRGSTSITGSWTASHPLAMRWWHRRRIECLFAAEGGCMDLLHRHWFQCWHRYEEDGIGVWSMDG